MIARRSIIIAAIALVLIGLATAAVLVVHHLLQPQRFTALVKSRLSDAGLTLQLAAPAEATLWPRPGVRLHGLRLSANDSPAPLLEADEGSLIVPWRVLLGNTTQIDQLRLDTPRVHLDALKSLLDAMPGSSAGEAPPLPGINAGVHIDNGTLLENDAVVLGNMDLDTGPLRDGKPFHVAFSAQDDAGHDYRFTLQTIPRRADGKLHLQGLELTLANGDYPRARMQGHLLWAGGLRLRGILDGTLARSDARSYAAALGIRPAEAGAPPLLAVRLDGSDGHLAFTASPVTLLAWAQALGDSSAPLNLPPLTGSAGAAEYDVGPVHLQGLSIESTPEPDVAAPSSSASAPDAATSTE